MKTLLIENLWKKLYLRKDDITCTGFVLTLFVTDLCQSQSMLNWTYHANLNISLTCVQALSHVWKWFIKYPQSFRKQSWNQIWNYWALFFVWQISLLQSKVYLTLRVLRKQPFFILDFVWYFNVRVTKFRLWELCCH